MAATEGKNIYTSSCIMCDDAVAKYRCPACGRQTCSLKCVKLHKEKNDCDGVRQDAAFVALEDMDNITLLRDYRFLEEMDRAVEQSSGAWKDKQHYTFIKLKDALRHRGVQYNLVPSIFERRQRNSTYVNYKYKKVFWTVEMYFQRTDLPLLIPNVSENASLHSILQRHVKNTTLVEDGVENTTIYIVKMPPLVNNCSTIKPLCDRNMEVINRYQCLRDLLRGKCVTEYPTFYIKSKNIAMNKPPIPGAVKDVLCRVMDTLDSSLNNSNEMELVDEYILRNNSLGKNEEKGDNNGTDVATPPVSTGPGEPQLPEQILTNNRETLNGSRVEQMSWPSVNEYSLRQSAIKLTTKDCVRN